MMDARNYSSTILLTDHEDGADQEMETEEPYPWAATAASSDSSPSNSPKSGERHHDISSTNHPWQKLVDTDEDDEDDERLRPTVFSNIQLMRSKLFDSTPANFPRAKRQDNFSPSEDSKDANEQNFAMNVPVSEISKHTRQRSDNFSDMSSLSGSKHNPIEFSLERGFEGQAPYISAVSEDIVRRLDRKAALREYESKVDDSSQRTDEAKCLILLVDPARKIFEIVQIPYQPELTTVGEVLSQLRHQATDYRLARQTYTGLAYQGMHICSPMVPVDIIMEAKTEGYPLFAVPHKYSAGQIEIIGKTLLHCPKVVRLLNEQVSKLAASSWNKPPLPSVIQSRK